MEKIDTPIRIAQIIGKMWAGGVEAVVFNYYKAIDHSKVQFDFFYDADSTVDPPGELIEMGAGFYKLPPYQQIWKYIPELKKYLKDNRYAIVHSHLNTLSIFPLFAAKQTGVPIRIAHNHSVPGGNQWRRNVSKNILKKFAKVYATDYFACSEKAARWLFGDREYEKGNVKIMNNAIDFGKFHGGGRETEKRKMELNLLNSKVYAHVGRFTFAKNHKRLLRIFKMIKEMEKNAKLLLVGDGELHEEITKDIQALKLQEDVIMTGKVHDPETYYPLMDAVILPSIFEGLSMTTVEAQIAGVPIIVSEAVPDEAIFSDACIKLNLSMPDTVWAENAVSVSQQPVNLTDRSSHFDITKCAPELESWYIKKQEGLRHDHNKGAISC